MPLPQGGEAMSIWKRSVVISLIVFVGQLHLEWRYNQVVLLVADLFHQILPAQDGIAKSGPVRVLENVHIIHLTKDVETAPFILDAAFLKYLNQLVLGEGFFHD